MKVCVAEFVFMEVLALMVDCINTIPSVERTVTVFWPDSSKAGTEWSWMMLFIGLLKAFTKTRRYDCDGFPKLFETDNCFHSSRRWSSSFHQLKKRHPLCKQDPVRLRRRGTPHVKPRALVLMLNQPQRLWSLPGSSSLPTDQPYPTTTSMPCPAVVLFTRSVAPQPKTKV